MNLNIVGTGESYEPLYAHLYMSDIPKKTVTDVMKSLGGAS